MNYEGLTLRSALCFNILSNTYVDFLQNFLKRKLVMKAKRVSLLLIFFSMAIILMGKPDQSEAGEKEFVGTYFTIGDEDEIPTPVIVQIRKDGTYLTVFGIQNTTLAGIVFTDDVGIWEKTGKNKIKAQTFSISALPPTESSSGEVVGNCIADHTITFTNNFQEINLTVSGKCYAPDVNPVDPGDAPVTAEFSGSFQGKRLNIP
ncbi:MAG: hypothetical protein A2099_01965 [Planctomycetes bacterium GWF2_39_10]|nr:MAG: hypothetical protein A2099_01965 [Planctomycetes bacterium GWF2_39_10]